MNDSHTSIRRQLDRVGVALAGLCALHCVLTVIVVSALGLGGHFLLLPALHRIGLALALVIAAVAIGWGAMKHRRRGPFITAILGLAFMGAALVIPHGTGEFVLTLIGVSLVALGHLLNMGVFDRTKTA